MLAEGHKKQWRWLRRVSAKEQLEQLKERSKLHGKLVRKSSMTDEITYSLVNATAVKEEVDQFIDTSKLLMSVHEEY